MTTGQEVATVDQNTSLMAFFRRPEVLEQIKLALPENESENRFVRTLLTALMERPELEQADRTSLATAVFKAAGMNLLPDGNESVILTHNTKVKVNGKDTWVQKATLIPMINGYSKLVAEYGWSLVGDVVYENDEFDEGSTQEPLFHRRAKLGTDRGDPVGAYALALHKELGFRQKIMDKAEIERIKKSSKNPTGMLWSDTGWWDRAWVKTAAKFVAKRLPLPAAARENLNAVLDIEDANGDDKVEMLYGRERAGEVTPLPLPERTGQEEPADAAVAGSDPVWEPIPDEADDGLGKPLDGEIVAEPADVPEEQEAAAPFEGEEPPEVAAEPEPAPKPESQIVFPTGSRHERKTIQEVFDAGDLYYLRWASGGLPNGGGFKTGPLAAELAEFVKAHPEIKKAKPPKARTA